ncbi:MAG: VCBS repeat-containing protein [Myxococcota bacterium]
MRASVLCATVVSLLAACHERQGEPSAPQPPAKATTATRVVTPAESAPTPATILLPQAQFVWNIDDAGKRRPTPGPAKLTLLTGAGNAWREQVLEDPESRVFHKALCVQTNGGVGLLTIGGTDALLKLWRREDSGWSATTLWHPKFGGDWDRLRDLEIGDLDGDGHAELVIGTHDQGVIATLARDGDAWKATEIYREPSTFVHEIELGDLDGDGKLEIYATPSKPNQAQASQPGRILVLRPTADGAYEAQVVANLQHSHAKEILVTDLDGNGRPELYAAIEAERGERGSAEAAVQIRRYLPKPGGTWSSTTVASLPGAVQARVLLAADLTGRARRDLIVTTMKAGIWRLSPLGTGNADVAKEQIDGDSAGFEHAAGVADVDGDGKLELYVVADDQDAVRQYRWSGTRFDRRVIATLEASDLTWSVEACRPVPW